ncbi:MAG: anaerobic ribonucleoside-triphosphate reductase activating protein [Clostridium sp.]|uniref:anaerobic ribonucleoside-triphosphate reductase activating protein n=1 Tax=Clostridium sp. TaxID=1506 RepID=UPI003F3FCDE1
MRYHNITKKDMLNGDGLRVVLWLSHCEHFCEGCHNSQTWCENSGIPFNIDAKKELFNELSQKEVSGITFSGGDPLSIKNRNEVLSLIYEIKCKYPTKDVWVYTGYLFDDVYSLEYFNNIDVLVDGKFIQSLSKPSPKWCGSSNQRIIDVQQSLKQNKIVEVEIK